MSLFDLCLCVCLCVCLRADQLIYWLKLYQSLHYMDSHTRITGAPLSVESSWEVVI